MTMISAYSVLFFSFLIALTESGAHARGPFVSATPAKNSSPSHISNASATRPPRSSISTHPKIKRSSGGHPSQSVIRHRPEMNPAGNRQRGTQAIPELNLPRISLTPTGQAQQRRAEQGSLNLTRVERRRYSQTFSPIHKSNRAEEKSNELAYQIVEVRIDKLDSTNELISLWTKLIAKSTSLEATDFQLSEGGNILLKIPNKTPNKQAKWRNWLSETSLERLQKISDQSKGTIQLADPSFWQDTMSFHEKFDHSKVMKITLDIPIEEAPVKQFVTLMSHLYTEDNHPVSFAFPKSGVFRLEVLTKKPKVLQSLIKSYSEAYNDPKIKVKSEKYLDTRSTQDDAWFWMYLNQQMIYNQIYLYPYNHSTYDNGSNFNHWNPPAAAGVTGSGIGTSVSTGLGMAAGSAAYHAMNPEKSEKEKTGEVRDDSDKGEDSEQIVEDNSTPAPTDSAVSGSWFNGFSSSISSWFSSGSPGADSSNSDSFSSGDSGGGSDGGSASDGGGGDSF